MKRLGEDMEGGAHAPTDEFNGYGQSMSGSGGVPSNKVMVSNVPSHCRMDDVELLLQQFGNMAGYDKLPSRDPHTQTYQVIYNSPEDAHHAASQMNNMLYEGSYLRAELGSDRKGGGGKGGRGRGGGFPGVSGRPSDFPLRILVQSEMVGAIIGRQGSTIKQITQQSRARVDVHRKDNVGSAEKAITIYGNPENCSNACKRILEVMKQEALSNSKGEIVLKILAHNNLIGRIIGKAGNTIKRIMQETETKITVSSINDINSFNLERIITVKGSIENMSKAESMISAKLRQSYENDLQAMVPQSMMFPGLHPMAMMATSGIGFGSRGNSYQSSIYSSAYPPVYQQIIPNLPADVQETTCLYIPNNAVGAIIGTKGSHIRNLISFSGASVKIAQQEGEKAERDHLAPDRKVTIVGSPEGQWKAQYLIFEKMREEGFAVGSEDIRLTVEITVPSSQVGRIIGRGGQNVRDLQRVTGSIIKLPEQGSNPPSGEEETTVHIIGPFFSVQSAQRRIRTMVNSPGGRRGTGGGPMQGPPPPQGSGGPAPTQNTSGSGAPPLNQQQQS